jgi:3-methyl-2-oxobutanoate hydroxymethyltransferase
MTTQATQKERAMSPLTPPAARRRVTAADLAAKRRAGEPIVMVTAYDCPGARAVADAGVDIVLVGDSAANTVLGYDSTREIHIDELLSLTKAVRRGLALAAGDGPLPMLVGDLPYGSYESGNALAVATARRFVEEAGCEAVKLEGGGPMADRARAIVAAGIPVMGHVGLLPQSVAPGESLRVQGRTAERALEIAEEAAALERAGVFAIVFEAVPAALTEALMPRTTVPIIGIGAGASCDGQVLVFHDLLGLHHGRPAKFVRQYAALFDATRDAVAAWAADVRARAFPTSAHSYGIDEAELTKLHAALGDAPRRDDPSPTTTTERA